MQGLTVNLKKLNENAVIPAYAHPGEDAGMDVVATSCTYDEKTDCYVYGTGLAFEVPAGYMMLIFPRSSNRKTDCYLANHVGVLDSGYRGELMLSFKNRTSMEVVSTLDELANTISSNADECGDHLNGYFSNTSSEVEQKAPYEVGDRIGQIIILPYPQIHFMEVEELNNSARGEGGHGSTGK